MRIAVVGSGNMGSALSKIWTAAGHDVALSYSRSGESLQTKAQAVGARAAEVAAAVNDADVIFIAVPWALAFDAVDQVNAALSAGNRVPVVLSIQALTADMSGLQIGTTTSASETLAARLPGTPVAFALFPFADLLKTQDRRFDGIPGAVFFSADDELAQHAAEALIQAADLAAVYVGPLSTSRLIEPFGVMLMAIAYGQGLGGQIGVQFLQRAATPASA